MPSIALHRNTPPLRPPFPSGLVQDTLAMTSDAPTPERGLRISRRLLRAQLLPSRSLRARLAPLIVLLVMAGGLAAGRASAQSVGVGIAVPTSSALLQIETNTKGFLIPRMTDSLMQLIPLPATSDLVFNNSFTNFYYYNGTIWTPLVGGGWSLTGDSGTTAGTNFLGTIDAKDFLFKTHSNERLRLFNGGDLGLISNFNVAEQLRFYEPSGDGPLYTGFRAAAQIADVDYLLPSGDGISNQALVTNGAGSLSWHTFATFGGSGSQSLWKRGSATGSILSDSSGNSSSGPYSLAEGKSNSVTGNYEIVFGGSNRGVSGSYGTVHGGASNGSTGDLDDVFGGQSNTASATASNIGGGSGNTTSGNEEVVLGGQGGTFSGTNSTIIGGYSNKISSNNELIYGYKATMGGGTGLVAFKIGSNTKMGIGTVAPAEALDVAGNVRFTGTLKPNNSAGSLHQYLLSAGASTRPTWGTATFTTTNWPLTGSTGSNPAINFIGTTDANDLALRTSNSERGRLLSTGPLAVGVTTTSDQAAIVSSNTTNELAALYGEVSAATASRALGIWGRANNTSPANTGTIALLATGSSATAPGATNTAIQLSQGEFDMGRTTEPPAPGTAVEPAGSGILYSQQGPSGVVQLSMTTDLAASAPVGGIYQNIGTVTINNRYIQSNSIIYACVLSKINDGIPPSPKDAVFRVDIESRTAGACVLRVGMVPILSDPSAYQPLDYIRIGYVVISPAK